METGVDFLASSTGNAIVIVFVLFVSVVAGGLVRLARAKGPVRPDPSDCINCLVESPEVCAHCHNEPAHDVLVAESSRSPFADSISPKAEEQVDGLYSPDYGAWLDHLQESGIV